MIESGITVRLPLLERYARLPRGRIRRPFVVAGRTIEGVEVRLSGEVDIRIVDPAEAAEASLVPADLALDEAERALARLVARRDVVSLADLPIDVELAIDVPGLRITEVDIAKVEIELTPRTVHSVVSQAK